MSTEQPATADIVAAILTELQIAYNDGLAFSFGDDHEYTFEADDTDGPTLNGTVWRTDLLDDLQQVLTVTIRAEVTSVTDRTHPDYDPSDVELIPHWDTLCAEERDRISTKLHAALEAGAE